jgi:hypothetical protein
MTGPEHYAAGEKLLESAADVLNADYGWMASLSAEERLAHRMADLAAAQAHFTAAQAAATALMHGDDDTMPADWHAWNRAAGASHHVEDAS